MYKFILALFLLISNSHANPLDSTDYNLKQPIEIEADSLEIIQNQQRAIFDGNVQVTQGNIKLNANNMIVHYKRGAKDGKNIQKIEVNGNVVLATPTESAKGNKGTYNVVDNMIHLVGNVTLSKGNNIIKGDKLSYNMQSGYSKVSTTKNGRVKGLFLPGQK